MKIEFIFLISTILALCSSDCKARAGSASRNDCATATSQAELLQRARENFQNRRFLLSSIDFSGAAAVACSADSRAEAGLGYARSLYELGETGAARSEWKKIAAFKEVADSLRLSAQLQLALLLGEESPTMLPAAKDVLSVWRAKGSPASYLGAVASTGFDKQLKV
ncbi:MAG: hypothetical protein ACXVBE_07800, partial [Bdellovibrionota bacterium]